MLTSVALSLAFKMRFWNIGGEGQFILGAVASAAVALKLKDSLPQGVVLILMCLAGMAPFARVWCLVRGAEKMIQHQLRP